MTVNVIINTQVEGLHNWPGCDIKEVEFLKYPHRHIFHICCKKEVTHDDRDVEIIMLKKRINNFIDENYRELHTDFIDFGSMSCEMIARELLEEFNLNYCSVLEDGENGAEIYI